MTTVHDVARRAGVSIATVSRVFGHPDAVAAATRQRVLSAADELGYAPNTSARALVRGRTGYLGLLVHDLANPFYATVAKAAQLEARRRGLALFCADYGDRPDEELALAKEMARHVDGLLLYPSQPADDTLRAAVAELGPAVLVDSPVDGVPHVVMSTAEGVDQAVDHLTALGHRGLTYVDAAPTTMFTSLDRRRNVEASCARAGLALSVVGPFSPSFESGVRAADLVIADGVDGRARLQRPDGARRRPPAHRARRAGRRGRQRRRGRRHLDRRAGHPRPHHRPDAVRRRGRGGHPAARIDAPASTGARPRPAWCCPPS